MAFTIMPYGMIQYFDDDGDPLAGGKLYTYIGGTSTPKETYQDAEGASSHANPVVLDSAGRQKVWLGDGSYKLILKTSSDVTVWTLDNITASSPTGQVDLMSDLRSLTPGIQSYVETLGYYAVGDGGGDQYIWNATDTDADDGGSVIQPNSLPATGRWNKVNNESYVNLKAFGCRCDGSTDDLTQFVKCDTYAVANDLRIVMTEGSCVISADPTIIAPLEMQTNAILKYDSFQPTITAIIEESDNTQHFDIAVGDVPVLDIPFFRPEWFGEDQTTHPIMTACIAASTLTRSYIHRLILPDDENIGCESDDDLLQISSGTLAINGTIRILDDSYIGILSDTDLLQLTSGVLVLNGGLRIDDDANIGIDSDADLLQLLSGTLVINGTVKIPDNSYIGILSHVELLQLLNGTLVINGTVKIPDNSYIGILSDTDLMQLIDGTLAINGTIRILDDSYIGIVSDTDLMQLIDGTLAINGTIRILDDSYIGILSDTDLLQLTSGVLVLNGGLRIDDDANIGIDSDADLLQLLSGTLVINGTVKIPDNSYIGILSHVELLQLTSGVLVVNAALRVMGSEGTSAVIYLDADEGDDTADRWALISDASTNALRFNNESVGVDVMTMLSTSGNVGIGTTNPAYPMDIQSSNAVLRVMGSEGTGATIYLYTDDGDDSADRWALISDVSTNALRFNNESVGVDVMTMLPTSGNVGIGTTNPQSKLQVNGNIVASDFYTTDWTDYSGTSTVVGWVATPTIAIVYKEVGDIVYVKYNITGTSNSATCSFTLPSASNGDFFNVSNQGIDNTVPLSTAGCISMTDASAVVGVSPLGVVGFSWTNHDTKTIRGSFWYRK